MATNDLYQLITDKMSNIDVLASGLAEKQKAAPTVEQRLREATMGNDAGLNDLRTQYSDGVMQLFKYDQEKAQSYLSPEAQAGGLVADPMAAESDKQMKFMSTAKTNQEVWKQLDKRKTVLGDLVKASMDKYNAELEGDKTLIDVADKQLSRALQLMTEERLASTATDDKTARERLRTENIDQLKSDLNAGATLGDVLDRYAKDLDQSDIVQTYNENNTYGEKAKESNQQINMMYRAAKTGTGVMDVISSIPNKQVANTVAAESLLAADSAKFIDEMSPQESYLQAISNGDFPLAKKIASKFGKDSIWYAQLNAFSANVIKNYYGSAFTSTEVNAAKQWIANPTIQAGNQLYAALVAHNNTATGRIRTSMKSVGFNDDYIDSYLKQIGANPTTGTSTTNNNSGSNDPLGIR